MCPAIPSVKVTVLMTLYNKGRFVEEALRSVLASTFTDFEVLVVDDASTDEGLQRVRALSDPRIRILESTENTGRASAANRGLDAARGDYVAVMDADDIMHADRLAKHVAFLDANPSVGACGSWLQVLGEPHRITRLPETDRGCRGAMLFGMPLSYGATTFRRSVIEAHHLRCIAGWRIPGMDYLFALSVGRHAQYANIPEVLLEYRMGENNMRFGRNEWNDRFALEKATFHFFEIPATDAELELHLAFHTLFRSRYDAARTKALWAWKQKLIQWNREHRLFTPDLFELELQRRWDRLFHLLADQDLGAAWAHLQLSGSKPMNRLVYLTKATLNRWMGRRR